MGCLAACSAGRSVFLRRHHQWPWRDVFLCGPRAAKGSLGDRRLYPRAPAHPPRLARRRAGRRARQAGEPTMTIRSARSVVAAVSGLVLIAGFVIDARSTISAYLV